MTEIQHRNITGAEAAHPPFYPSEGDPGSSLGAYRGWIKPSTGDIRIRNAANTAWIDPSLGVDGSGGHVIQDEASPLTARTNLNFTGAGVTVTDDAANDRTDVDIPGGTADPATETTAGIIELATQGETNAGTDNARAITPQKLQNKTASESASGILELATQAEVNAGIDDARAVTPAKLAARAASTTATGLIELATQAETDSGTDATRAVTPSTLAGRSFERTTNKNQPSGYVGLSASPGTPDGTKFLRDDLTWQSASAGGGLVSVDGVSNAGGNVDFVAGSNMTITPDDTANTITFASTGGGGGSGYRTLVELGSDFVTSSTTITDVTGLSFSVTSGVTYRFYALAIYEVSNVANGTSWAINGPASPTLLAWHASYPGTTQPTESVQYSNVYAGPTQTSASPFTTNIVQLSGIIKPSTSGTVAIRCRSEVGTETITVKAGSTLEWW